MQIIIPPVPSLFTRQNICPCPMQVLQQMVWRSAILSVEHTFIIKLRNRT